MWQKMFSQIQKWELTPHSLRKFSLLGSFFSIDVIPYRRVALIMFVFVYLFPDPRQFSWRRVMLGGKPLQGDLKNKIIYVHNYKYIFSVYWLINVVLKYCMNIELCNVLKERFQPVILCLMALSENKNRFLIAFWN